MFQKQELKNDTCKMMRGKFWRVFKNEKTVSYSWAVRNTVLLAIFFYTILEFINVKPLIA